MIYHDLPTADRVIVIGDIHGDIGILCSCLYMTNIINQNLEWIAQPANTIVVQMGDQVDSLSRDTSPSWEKVDDCTLLRFTEKIDEIAKRKGGRFISMIGNHELMNVLGNYDYVSTFSLNKSGGHSGRMQQFQPGGMYAQILSKRPVVQKIGPLIFCHAGLLPHHIRNVDNSIHKINELFYKFLNKESLHEYEKMLIQVLFIDDNSILWNRLYLEQMGPNMEQALQYVLENTNTKHMMIGHNPLSNITPFYNLRLWETDVGLSRAFSNDSIEVLEILNGGEACEQNDFKPFRVIKAIKK